MEISRDEACILEVLANTSPESEMLSLDALKEELAERDSEPSDLLGVIRSLQEKNLVELEAGRGARLTEAGVAALHSV